MLRVTRTDGNGRLRIALAGVIDDTVDLEPVFANLPSSVELDLRGIERINSIGVRRWVALMGTLSAKHHFIIEAVELTDLSKPRSMSVVVGVPSIRRP